MIWRDFITFSAVRCGMAAFGARATSSDAFRWIRQRQVAHARWKLD
jgi:hypothetical protein